MASWDDEDFEVPAAAAAVPANWDDEEEEEVMDSWDAEEKPKPKTTTKTTTAAPKMAQRKAMAQMEREMAAMKLKPEDATTRRDRQRQAEVDSDLMNASELFGNSGAMPDAVGSSAAASAAPQAPLKLSDLAIFHPKEKKEFTELKDTLAPILTSLNNSSPLIYPDFAITFAKAIAEPLKVEQLRKLISTLNAYQNERIRQEKAARGKKKKPSLAAASAKINDDKDTSTYNDNFDDFDDFM